MDYYLYISPNSPNSPNTYRVYRSNGEESIKK